MVVMPPFLNITGNRGPADREGNKARGPIVVADVVCLPLSIFFCAYRVIEFDRVADPTKRASLSLSVLCV